MAALLLVGAGSGAARADDAVARRPVVRLELLDVATIPGGTRFGEVCVGGWSGIAPLEGDRYVVVADARVGARFFTVEIRLAIGDGGRPRLGGVKVEGVTPLRTREGVPFPDRSIDAEGLAPARPGAVYLSSEGIAPAEIPPFVDLLEVPSGRWRAALPISEELAPGRDPDGRAVGVRQNHGFEALTTFPDRSTLVVATESALAQDFGDPAAGDPLWSRLLVYRLGEAPHLDRRLLYPLVQPPGDVVAHGVVSMLALDDAGRLLALERTFARDRGLHLAFYELDLGKTVPLPADPGALSAAARALPSLEKRLVLDLLAAGLPLENYEGMTFGPRLPDGGETLLVIGDNDNVDCPDEPPVPDRATKVLLFRLERR